MNDATGRQGHRRLIVTFMVVGFLIGVLIWAYELLSAHSSRPIDMRVATLFVIFCPPGLLEVPFFELDPGTLDHAVLWLIISLLNAALYAAVGWLVAQWYEWYGSRKKARN